MNKLILSMNKRILFISALMGLSGCGEIYFEWVPVTELPTKTDTVYVLRKKPVVANSNYLGTALLLDENIALHREFKEQARAQTHSSYMIVDKYGTMKEITWENNYIEVGDTLVLKTFNGCVVDIVNLTLQNKAKAFSR